MDGFELSIVINKPIEDVFGALTNLENDIKWRSEWVETRNTSGGGLGVGATFCLTGEFLGRRVPTTYEVIEYEPNRRAAWKTVSGPLPLTFERTFERVEGSTRFTTERSAYQSHKENNQCQQKPTKPSPADSSRRSLGRGSWP